MSLDVRSAKLLDLVDSEAQVEQIGTGCVFTEGPIWNAEGDFLLFSDIPANQMKKWSPDSGITTFRQPSGKSNGLTYDKQKHLIACEHANRRVSRTEPDGTVTTIASHYEGKKLNSPNDVVVKSDGNIYFTDPPYGLTAMYGEEGGQELDFQGVYRLSGQELTLLVEDFDRPNGLCFSPDESILYIDDTARMHVRAFDVQPDGTLANGRIFAEEEGENGVPDGMKVDQQGNVYLTGPDGIWIFDPAGTHLGVIQVPEVTANLGWGEDDWKTLFITATSSIYRIQLKVSGIPVP
ncbi:TPA: SMP-30/gluconolactonase/LRE family protein [Candidatus Poribacteria bacterium]|jgi:gluconolactonase|nr:SMP-30/gluconolactonase/LRE family protein [Candidatus Poribacteria bacterium]HIA70949.1 SMP-30/gluconolactonase/LRE family protein [Candidatus Poribacteria bacterium]HIB91628.1 SMP-30/gluconolactonase/LRE family protein [Candidatus Poribacteria bacterium]HIC00073.1 SMP-30/gluconolactonase/LRE family protein [Candidatus Poribacteria bacterium]HIN31519.1 SMP-30/gluconolactonase/LRE family protein [Candidatus Poribacteria bacterium]